ncbi:PREDICTED: uncharacterized protein LOC107099599 [Cyprinodon variegatus]|uniref:uncharacterized protein LOC107099599 n=1 Tax=Cyprinodon variegatus TaxID=28743 RepID=UPI000742AD47|nr:PREDICTED: uncharacterized protein LOC107099599 [Cyprinodon variegatus]
MAASADISTSALSRPATEMRIVLIGGRYDDPSSGKSSAGNIILGHNVFDTSRRTTQSEARQQEVLGRRLTVVDTPGWWWHYPREETPKLDQIEIQNSVHLCPPGPHVFLLVIPVRSNFSQHVKPSLKEHLELFKADVFSHTIVLFTAVHPCSDETIESEIRGSPVLQWILQQCGNRKHVLNISNREDRDQVKMLLEKTEKDLKALVEVLMPLTERVWRHCMVLFTRGEWLNVLPVENYIVREGKELQELLEKCGNRYHVLSFFNYDDPVQVKELFQTIINMVKQNKGCFTTEGKRKKFQFLPQQRKQRILTEEEWNRREQELMERMMKALAKEPEKPTVPSVEVAESKDDFVIPDMSEDVSSEHGSISEVRNQRAHNIVAEWLAKRVRQSEISSGMGSICSSVSYMEKHDEDLQ